MSGPRIVLAVWALAVPLPAADAPLNVRASLEAAPCVLAAASAYSRPVAVETGALRGPGSADVLVGSSVEINRALEGGDAVVGSEEALARIPWVLSVAPGNPLKITGLGDLARPGLEVVVLGGPAAYEARRALSERQAERVRESRDGVALRRAAIALVPLSMAGGGEKVAVDVEPIPVGAAVSVHSTRLAEARAFVSFLVSDKGQAAFVACGLPSSSTAR